MKVQILCVTMLVMASLALPSMGATYNYGDPLWGGQLSLTDGSWSLVTSGEYFSALFTPTQTDHQMEFVNTYFDGETYPHRAGYYWTAPAGEVITGVQFYWNRQGIQTMNPTVFSHNASDPITADTILWSTNGGGLPSTEGSMLVSINQASAVTCIGLGFSDTVSEPGNSVIFNMVTIETSAPPKHIVTGSVARGGFTGDLSDIGVKVEFAQNGTVVKTAQVFLNANGGFTIPEVVHGTYDVTVRGGFWFKKTFSAAAVLEDVVLPTITLVQGDLNADSMVDVGDLGILAANYGSGSGTTSASNFSADYAKVFNTTASETTADAESDSATCTGLGLPLVAGLALMGLMLVKLDE